MRKNGSNNDNGNKLFLGKLDKLNDKKNKTNNSLLSFDSKSEEENSIFFQEYYSLVNPLDVSFKLFYNKYSSLSFRGPPIKLYFSETVYLKIFTITILTLY